MALKCAFFTIFSLTMLFACSGNNSSPDPFKIYKYREHNEEEPLLGYDIEIFKGTRAWELAKAVYEQDTNKIMLLAKSDTSLMSFTDKKIGMNLLDWAIFNYRYYSSRSLLKAGSDPNFESRVGTPLTHAAKLNYSSIFLTLLLDFGGNVNTKVNVAGKWVTPLEVAASHRLESVKILVKAGAEVNYANETKSSVLSNACSNNDLEVAYYLISECGADYKHPLIISEDGKKAEYVTDVLEHILIDKGTDKYRMRQKIIDYIYAHDTTDYSRPYQKLNNDSTN